MSSIDQAVFRDVMGNYPTGVTVITATDREGNPVGLTVNSFASVSLDPLLILWSIDHQSSSLGGFLTSEQFAVHILAEEQKEVAALFAKKGAERFSQCDWTFSEQQLPVLDGAAAVLQCRVFNQVEAGDHTILIGEVTELLQAEKEALLFHKGKMGSLAAKAYSS